MKRKFIWIITIIAILIAICAFGYFYFFAIEAKSSSNGSSGTPLKNPAEGLSLEQAAANFNETFIYYLLLSMGAWELHNPPLSSSTPKMQIEVDELIFNAEIINGGIRIGKGTSSEKDIVIRTSKIEAVKMLKNREYIKESFNSGNSNIELVAGKATLFSKGYLKIYDKFS